MTDSAPGKASAGALLKAAREAQGLHIAALAAAIKVAPRKLDALENDRWGELPDATFTRALAQTVCRTLKIDARPVLELLPQPTVMALGPGTGGLNTPFEGRPGRDEPGLAGMAIRPMVLAAGVLMVAALVVYFLPPGLWSPGTSPPVAASAPMPASAAAAAATVASSAAPAATLASAPSAVSAAQLVAGAAASAPHIAGETTTSAPPSDGAASVAVAAAAGLVQLSTSEPSWVDVREAGGQILLSRNLLPGESVGLDGALPIRLVIGNAAATRLAFRGRPVDLAARTRDNVARVELP